MKVAETTKKKNIQKAPRRSSSVNVLNTLIRPRVTEKASFKGGEGVYVFEIDPRATKKDVSRAVEKVYSVKPLKVLITHIPSKRVFVRGVRGVKKGGEKAYVYLRKGDKIEVL